MPFVCAEDLGPGDLDRAVAQARPDLIFSFYYRSMIASEVLGRASSGAFNMHGSLLPMYRGRAPTNWAVLHGATQTGATLHEMVAQPDAGAIVDQSAVPILPDDTARQVFDKVCVAAEQVLWRSLPGLLAGTAPRRANDIARGSYFGGRKPEDGRIDFEQPAAQVYNLIRAVAPPYPGAFVDIGAQRLVIARARRLAADRFTLTPGSRPGLHVLQGQIVALCGDGGLIDVQALLCAAQAVDAAFLETLLSATPAVGSST